MGRIKLDPISEFARQGYDMRAAYDCGKVSEWNAAQLTGELSYRRYSLLVEKWSSVRSARFAYGAVRRLCRCSSTGVIITKHARSRLRPIEDQS